MYVYILSQSPLLLFLEVLEQRIGTITVDVDFGEHVKLDPVPAGKRFDDIFRLGLLKNYQE